MTENNPVPHTGNSRDGKRLASQLVVTPLDNIDYPLTDNVRLAFQYAYRVAPHRFWSSHLCFEDVVDLAHLVGDTARYIVDFSDAVGHEFHERKSHHVSVFEGYTESAFTNGGYVRRGTLKNLDDRHGPNLKYLLLLAIDAMVAKYPDRFAPPSEEEEEARA